MLDYMYVYYLDWFSGIWFSAPHLIIIFIMSSSGCLGALEFSLQYESTSHTLTCTIHKARV